MPAVELAHRQAPNKSFMALSGEYCNEHSGGMTMLPLLSSVITDIANTSTPVLRRTKIRLPWWLSPWGWFLLFCVLLHQWQKYP
jgi:hypothetical protein